MRGTKTSVERTLRNVAIANSPHVSSFLNPLRPKAARANRSRFAPVFQTDDVGGLSEVSPEVAETGTDQSDGGPEFVWLNLHILGPMVNLNVARGVLT